MNEITIQPPLDPSFLIECIKEWYSSRVVSIHHLPSDSGKHIYQVNVSDGAVWTLRVEEIASRPAFIDLAHLLLFFEQHHYSAERLVFTREQTTMVALEGWQLLMTTFLIGTPLSYTPSTFFLLGTVIRQLHALKPKLSYIPPQARMLPEGELAFAQQQLEEIGSQLPHRYSAQYEFLERALSSINRGIYLPTTLIHTDCHLGNAIMTAPDHVTLLDWEEAGMGPAVIDVGFLLANCDGKAPWDALSTDLPEKENACLQAVIEGYHQFYQLNDAELNYLDDAIRFRSLVFGACSFASAIAQQKNAEFSQLWWKRYCVAEELADRARSIFVHKLQE